MVKSTYIVIIAIITCLYVLRANSSINYKNNCHTDKILLNRCNLVKNGYKNNADTIYWSKKIRLKKDDFQADVDRNDSEFGAVALLNILFNYKEFGSYYKAKVETIFVKHLSWDKIGLDSIGLLHEQKHFDLEEIYARKLRKIFIDREYYIVDKQQYTIYIDSISKEIYYKIGEQAQKAQIEYDNETNHSLNKEMQQKWNLKIAKELKDLDKYAE